MKRFMSGLAVLSFSLVGVSCKEKEKKVDNPDTLQQLQDTQRELDELKSISKDQNDEVLNLTDNVNELASELAELKEQKASLEADKSKLEQDLENSIDQAEYDKIAADLAAVNERLEGLGKELSDTQESLNQANAELEKAQAELEETKTNRDTLAQELDEVLALYRDTSRKLLDYMLSNDIITYEAAKASANAEIEAAVEGDVVVKAGEKVKSAEIVLADAQAVNDEALAKVELIQGELEAFKSSLDPEADIELINRIDAYFLATSELDAANMALKMSIEELEKVQTALEETQALLDGHRAALAAKELELSELASAVDPDLEAIRALGEEIETLKDSVIPLSEEAVVEAQVLVESQQGVVDQRNTDVNSATGIVASALESVDEIRGVFLSEAQDQLKTASQELEAASLALQNAEQEKALLISNLDDLNDIVKLLGIVVPES